MAKKLHIIATSKEQADRKAVRYGKATFLSRRNSLGHHSSKGRNFFYEISPRRKKKKKIRKEEYVLRFSYSIAKNKKRGQLALQVRVEIHVTGPAKAKRETVIKAARSVFGSHVSGFNAEIIAWSKEYIDTGRTQTYRDRSTFNNGLVRSTVGTGNPEFRNRSDTKL
jgi:hypothetical protein